MDYPQSKAISPHIEIHSTPVGSRINVDEQEGNHGAAILQMAHVNRNSGQTYNIRGTFDKSFHFNPSNAVATFAQSTRMLRFFKTIKTLSYWYSLESSCWALSDEYPFAKGFKGFSGFLHNFVLANLAVSSISVNRKISSIWALSIDDDLCCIVLYQTDLWV